MALVKLQQEVTRLRAEGKYKETIESCYKLLKLGLENQDYKSILTAHINNAASYYCIGAIEEAFQSIEAYEEVCSKHGDEADFLSLYNVLFLLYDFKKDFLKAKDTLSKTIELGKRLEKYNIVSNGYSNYSHIYIVEGNYVEALEMASKGLEMARMHQPSSRILELRVTLNMAQSYIGLGNMEGAKVFIDEIHNDPILETYIREKSQAYILLGNWFVQKGLLKEALHSLTSAKELVESYNDVYLLKEIQEKRSEICEKLNDIENGYKVQKEYISLLNEISNRELALAALKLDLKHHVTETEKKANTDFLTGLYNRSFLESVTDRWLREAARNQETIVCIVFDIDHFKKINDDYGHLFGDEVIKQVGITCSSINRENETVGRYGGDEFVIIIKNTTNEQAMKRAKHFKETVESMKISKEGNTTLLKVSMGIASNANGRNTSFTELFHAADNGLYQAKKCGKDQIVMMG